MAEEAGELANNLENLLTPFCYEQETPLPITTPEVPGGIYLSGFISQDCTWGCCFNQSAVKCFPVYKYYEDNHSVNHSSNNTTVVVSSSSHTFTGGNITCATELAIHNQRVSSGTRKLLLGLSYTGGENNNRDPPRGALVIFDPIRCAPMKWIEIPEPVSSVTVLSHFEEGGSNRPFFNETMMAMVGIAAVGLRGGSVIIVDLGLDDPQLTSCQPVDLRNSFIYRLLNVNPHEYVIATKRHKAVSKRSLISIKFSNEPEDEMVSDDFHYCKPTGESILVLPKTRVAVTCIEYVPAIGSLLVGFTCGGFQIWRVSNMELQFSSDPIHLDRDVPVFGFSFQQPVDDPKNYCYVWVMYGNKSAEFTNTHLELYSLLYNEKHFIDNFGYAYDDFRQCAKRMSFPLMDDFVLTDGENDSSLRAGSRPIRIWSQPDSDLMFCAWEVERRGVYYLGAFDMNQWYSNHTKEYVVYNPITGLCPYWVAIPAETSDDTSIMLDLRILPKSLMRWENPHAKLDVHLYPASVSFRAICLTNTGVAAFEHFGIQEKLIRIMMKDGPTLMIQPSVLKNSFLRYGLEPAYPHVYGEHLSQKDRDRFFILSVLLESRRTVTIIRCASAWLDGSLANVGCTLDLIIDWIGSYMVAVRNLADEHWDNLFHFEDDVLPPETIRFINFSNFAWKSLHCMLRILMNPSEVYSARGQELEDIEFGLGKLVQYSAAMLVMYKAKLLPEGTEGFFRKLSEFYEQRRQETKNALDSCPYIDKQYKKSHPLMIDYLMDDLLAQEDIRSEWHVEEGQPLYPPQHAGYLVNMFLCPDVDPRTISRIFLYFLIDLNSFFAQYGRSANCEIERKVRGDIKAIIDTAGDEYQEILVLWLLDHGVQEEILMHLKERDRLFESDGLPWCAATVALTAAGFESDVAELLLKSCPHSLARLLFSLMASSITRYNSLAELMVSSNLSSNDTLLQEFFEISENHDRLGEFIRTRSKELPDGVRDGLLAFLNKSNSIQRLSQLLMYYVHIQDYSKLEEEFARVCNILRQLSLTDKELKTWRFQETYITHLLKTKRSVAVENFIRFQSPHLVRRTNPTITIKAVPVQGDDSVFKRTPERIQDELKAPIQIRRLKLTESMAQDPLSPLRRYAGRIQSAFTSDSDSDRDELRSRRLSRKSISHRFSFSANRQSMGNRNFNDSFNNQEGLNVSLKNTSFDLMSLLKRPSLNHRSLNKSRQSLQVGFNNSLNQTATTSFAEPVPSTSFQVHSIMKEKDSTKPKVNKKVELNLERLSLNSSSEEDEKNKSVYEDANDDIRSDENITSGEGFEVESPDAVLESSYKTVLEMSVAESESTSEYSSPSSGAGVNEPQPGVSSKIHDAPSVRFADVSGSASPVIEPLAIEKEKSESSESETSFASNVEEKDHTIHGLSIIAEQDENEEGSENVSGEQPNDEPPSSEITRKDSDNNSALLFTPPRPPSKSTTPSPKQSPSDKSITSSPPVTPEMSPLSTPEKSIVSRSPSKTPEKSIDTVSPSKTPEKAPVHVPQSPPKTPEPSQAQTSPSRTPSKETQESTSEPVGMRTRSSVSRTPTKEAQDEKTSEVSVSPPQAAQRRLRTSRSRTPTRQPSEELKTEEVAPQRKTRSSRTPSRDTQDVESTSQAPADSSPEVRVLRKSRTPSRDVESTEEPEPKKRRNSGRSSTSRATTPTRDLPLEDAPEGAETKKKVRRTSGRSSRATTPTRDVTLEEIPEESEGIMTRRRSRLSRSRTPTRELSASELDETLVKEILENKPTRRTTRKASSRSTTPTRELVVDESIVKQEASRTLRSRSTRSTRSQGRGDIYESEDDDEDVVSQIFGDSSQKSSQPPPRSRVTRSRTPTREKVELDDSIEEVVDQPDKIAQRRTLRSTRSTTPTRDLEKTEEDKHDSTLEKSKSGRSRRTTRSKTPSVASETQESDASNSSRPKGKKTRSRKKSETEESVVEVKVEPIEEDEELDNTVVEQKEAEKEASVPEAEASHSRSTGSFSFEKTTNENEEDSDEDEKLEDILADIQTKRPAKKKSSVFGSTAAKGRKRRLKYFEHEQELSTLLEDSNSDVLTEPSVLEATVVPDSSLMKQRRIKGIRPRPSSSSSTSVVQEPVATEKPTKRRKSIVNVDIDDEEEEDDDTDAQSYVSSRSNRSVSSKRSTASSTKGRQGRRGRSKKN